MRPPGAPWSVPHASSGASTSDGVLRCCDRCGRMRVGTGPWRRATDLRADPAFRALTLPTRLTLCRECLASDFPEYFAV